MGEGTNGSSGAADSLFHGPIIYGGVRHGHNILVQIVGDDLRRQPGIAALGPDLDLLSGPVPAAAAAAGAQIARTGRTGATAVALVRV